MVPLDVLEMTRSNCVHSVRTLRDWYSATRIPSSLCRSAPITPEK